jgi:SGNH hydrolase-like domain, acetyltransferase AlgX
MIGRAAAPMPSVSRKAALLACGIPALYMFAGTAFALIYFREYASSLPQFLRYVAAPLVLGGVMIVLGLKLSTSRALAVGLSSLAILGGLFAFEAVMTVRVVTILLGYFSGTNTAGANSQSVETGLPTGFTSKRLNRYIGTKDLQHAILGGIPFSDVLLCWQGSTPIRYIADRFGYNNPDKVLDTEINTIIVGDSFIEGMCQSPGKDIAAQLRVKIPGTVSFGTRGAGPLFGLAALGRFGRELKPTNVVIAFFEGNDWENFASELEMPWLASALKPQANFGPAILDRGLLERAGKMNAKVRRNTAPAYAILTKTRLVRNFFALNQTWTQLGLTYPKTTAKMPQYDVLLAMTKQLAAGWNGKVTLLYIPQSVRYIGLLPRDFIYDKLRTRVVKAAKANGIDVIDLVEAFRQEDSPSKFYAADAHFTDEGAAFAADAIERHITEGEKTSITMTLQ